MSWVVASIHALAGFAAALVTFALAGLATLGLLLTPMLMMGFIVWWLTLIFHNEVETSLAPAYEETSETTGRLTASDDMAIAERAYALYLARGCQPGHDIEDWLQAERELTGFALVAANA